MNAHEFDKDIFRATLKELLGGKKMLHAEVMQSVEKWMDSGKAGLLLKGRIGTGKTTLAYAIRNSWCKFLTVAEVRKCDWIAEQIKQDASWMYEIADAKGLMILDDFGTERKVWGEEPLLPIIYRRYENRLPTVITTNLNSAMIQERYGERVADRLRDYSHIVMDYNSLRGDDTDNH